MARPERPRFDGPEIQAARQSARQAIDAFRSKTTGMTAHEAINAAAMQPPPEAHPHFDETRLPIKLPPNAKYTNVAPMFAAYAGEETGKVWGTKVAYFDEKQRAQMEITVKDGKLYDASGQLFDTKSATNAFGPEGGKAIFVMSPDGKLYASLYQAAGKVHHSSFLAGQAVAAAGELEVHNGELKAMSGRSGHYRPTMEQLNQAVQSLAALGVKPFDVKPF